MFNDFKGQANLNWDSRLWNIIMSTPPLNISKTKNKVGSKVGWKYCAPRTSSICILTGHYFLLSPGSRSPLKSLRSIYENKLSKNEGKECFEFSSWSERWGEEGSRDFRKVVSLLKNRKQSGKYTKWTAVCECSPQQMQYAKQGTIQSLPG